MSSIDHPEFFMNSDDNTMFDLEDDTRAGSDAADADSSFDELSLANAVREALESEDAGEEAGALDEEDEFFDEEDEVIDDEPDVSRSFPEAESAEDAGDDDEFFDEEDEDVDDEPEVGRLFPDEEEDAVSPADEASADAAIEEDGAADGDEVEVVDIGDCDADESEAEGEDAFDDLDEPEAEEKPARKKHKGLKIFLITLASLVGLLAIAYFAGVYYFHSHFGFGSYVNDVDCSYMTVPEVQDVLEGQVGEYSLMIRERGARGDFLSAKDVGLSYVRDEQVQEILDTQDPFRWPIRGYYFFREGQTSKDYRHPTVTVDDAKLKTALSRLHCMDPENMIAPEDAYPELQGAVYGVHPEVLGTTVDEPVFTEEVKKAFLATQEEAVDMEALDCYVKPAVTAEDPTILNAVDSYNKYVGLSITYHFGDQTEVLDGSITNSWFSWDENYNVTIDQDKIKAWARDFGSRHDTVGKSRTFTSVTGAQAEVSGGSYGWSVDEAAEIEAINQMFTDLQSQDREPIWEQTAASFGSNDWGNTYLEVSLSAQHVWYVVDGSVVFESDVVTGLPNGKRNTPAGVWSILEMKRDKVLRGDRQPDGEYEYETPVAYWMRVTWSGVGFHDATWQPWFGGNRYTYAGSHGCINMPYSAAQTLYGLTYVGCPVIVHY